MSLLLTGKGGRRYEWIAPIDPVDVLLAGLGLFPESGDLYHDAARRKDGVLTNTDFAAVWQWDDWLRRPYLSLQADNDYIAWNWPNIDEFTACCWWKGSYGWILGGGESRDMRVVNNKLLFQWYSPTPPSSNVYGTTTVNTGAWFHLTIRRLAGINSVWVNGVEENSAECTANIYSWNAIGQRGTGTGFSPQSFADLLIVGKGLATDQIAWLADPSNRPVRPWRRRALPSAGVTDLGDILGRFDSPLSSAIVQGALCV